MKDEHLPLRLPCGYTAEFDEDSVRAHRCTHCGAVVGSISVPRRCADKARAWEALELIGGSGWDYITGKPKVKND